MKHIEEVNVSPVTIKKILLSWFIVLFLILPVNNSLAGHIYSTREVLELDTCASAWLIKRFVDKEAEFKFFPKGEFIKEGVQFNTPYADLSRTHNLATFEVILQRYNLKDPKLLKIGKIIHDIEINYWGKKLEPESEKINRDIVKIIKESTTPQGCFTKSFAYFDNLYSLLDNKTSKH